MDTSFFITEISLNLLLFFLIRFWNINKFKGVGCDSFNMLLNLETFEKTKKIPVDIENIFMLENSKQWYPPLYLAFLSIFPINFIKKNHHIINHLFDSINLILFLYICNENSFSFEQKITLTCIYASSIGIINEFYSLNVRPIGLVIFNFSIYGLLFFELNEIIYWIWIPGVILFYTHKLSFQALIYVYLIFSIFLDIKYFLCLLIIIPLSFLIWPEGFIKLSKAHFNILLFWKKNWNKLGSHIIRESIFYNDKKTRNGFYDQKENKNILRYTKKILGYNYFLIPFIYVLINYDVTINKPVLFIVAIYLLVIITHWVKILRFLGLGFQYIKFSFLPLIFFIVDYSIDNSILFFLTAICIIFHFRSFFLFLKNTSFTQAGSSIKKNLIRYIKNNPIDNIMILPTYYADQIGYLTRKRVYWGTHGEVFDERLNNFFPVLKKKLNFYKKDGVNFILIDEQYFSPKEINLKNEQRIFKTENFSLFKL